MDFITYIYLLYLILQKQMFMYFILWKDLHLQHLQFSLSIYLNRLVSSCCFSSTSRWTPFLIVSSLSCFFYNVVYSDFQWYYYLYWWRKSQWGVIFIFIDKKGTDCYTLPQTFPQGAKLTVITLALCMFSIALNIFTDSQYVAKLMPHISSIILSPHLYSNLLFLFITL